MKYLRFYDKSKNYQRIFKLYFFVIMVFSLFAIGLIIRTYNETDRYEEYLGMTINLKKACDEIDNSMKIASTLCQLIQNYDNVKEYANEKASYHNTDFFV